MRYGNKCPPAVVLVVGANGFLGGYLVAALRQEGFTVIKGVRSPNAFDERVCDFSNLDVQSARDAVKGVDCVVNAAGILRETGKQTFQAIHVDGPTLLVHACIENNITQFIQVSALGLPEDGDFILSKHKFDQFLISQPLCGVVLRPSVVYSASGSYGGTSLLRALAAFPGAQWLPGNGEWLVQPVAVEDLAKIVVKAVLNKTQGYYEVGGPTPMTLKDYQQTWRTWFRVKGQGTICVPKWLVSIQVWLSEYTGNGPIGNTMWKMLKRGNITTPDANKRLTQDFGIETRRLADVLAQHPSQVQDRWMAQLYFLAPALKIAVIALWLISSLAGFLTPAKDILAMVDGSLLQHTSPVGLARIGGALDMMLGVWLASGWRPRWAIGAMMLSVFAYTMIFGFSHPKYWLDPLGGLAKNLVLIPTLAILWVLSERR